jgi:hypothetical protein
VKVMAVWFSFLKTWSVSCNGNHVVFHDLLVSCCLPWLV